jgi:hypothetical protein
MSISDDVSLANLFPGRFLKSEEMRGRDATLTISDVLIEKMEDKKKGMVDRLILSFRETERQLLVNKTNAECMKGLFETDRPARWVGRKVTLYPVTVEAFGAPTLAIRVRGSPELTQDKTISVKVGRNPAVSVTMKKTGQKAANGKQSAAAAPTPPPEPPPDAPEMDAETGEVPFN